MCPQHTHTHTSSCCKFTFSIEIIAGRVAGVVAHFHCVHTQILLRGVCEGQDWPDGHEEIWGKADTCMWRVLSASSLVSLPFRQGTVMCYQRSTCLYRLYSSKPTKDIMKPFFLNSVVGLKFTQNPKEKYSLTAQCYFLKLVQMI